MFGPLPLFIDGIIFNAIKNGTPENKMENVLLYFGDNKDAIQKIIAPDNDGLIYIFLTGKTGEILYRASGLKASEKDIEELFSSIKP